MAASHQVRHVPVHGPAADCRAVVCTCRHTPAQVAELLHLPPSQRPARAAQIEREA